MNRWKAERTISPNNALLALDVGEKRIGVALARLDIKISRPHTTLQNDATFDERLKELMAENGVSTIVVGLPRGLEGQETEQTAYVKQFALDHLADYTTVFQDEALTSKLAESELAKSGVSYTKEEVDALAACFILRDYLEQHIIS
ncbi:MAG: Holliday junction resolvase RuvX [Candidatus Saccharibacteria bacterium]|nr:Holliday junction resolvase RuvX [Candidatus Saccharibacteria bacterium]